MQIAPGGLLWVNRLLGGTKDASVTRLTHIPAVVETVRWTVCGSHLAIRHPRAGPT